MNPCFFLLNKDSNHIEFHSQNLNSDKKPKLFKKVMYIPDQFEAKPFETELVGNFNFKFLIQGLYDSVFYSKLFEQDKQIIIKERVNFGIHSVVIPYLFGRVLLFSRKKFSPHLKENHFLKTKICRNLFIGIAFSLYISNTFKILTDQRLFLTGINRTKLYFMFTKI